MNLFFFSLTAPPDVYPLSLHDALPIFVPVLVALELLGERRGERQRLAAAVVHDLGVDDSSGKTLAFASSDRKSTRLNSSHSQISYAVLCLKKKEQEHEN